MDKKKWRKLSKLRPGALFVTKDGQVAVKWTQGAGMGVNAISLDEGAECLYHTKVKVRELDLEHLLVNSDDEDLLMLIEAARGDGAELDEWNRTSYANCEAERNEAQSPVTSQQIKQIMGDLENMGFTSVATIGGVQFNPRQSEPPVQVYRRGTDAIILNVGGSEYNTTTALLSNLINTDKARIAALEQEVTRLADRATTAEGEAARLRSAVLYSEYYRDVLDAIGNDPYSGGVATAASMAALATKEREIIEYFDAKTKAKQDRDTGDEQHERCCS